MTYYTSFVPQVTCNDHRIKIYWLRWLKTLSNTESWIWRLFWVFSVNNRQIIFGRTFGRILKRSFERNLKRIFSAFWSAFWALSGHWTNWIIEPALSLRSLFWKKGGSGRSPVADKTLSGHWTNRIIEPALSLRSLFWKRGVRGAAPLRTRRYRGRFLPTYLPTHLRT